MVHYFVDNWLFLY